jgi:4-hydroxybenzoate polyprenyltransferase
VLAYCRERLPLRTFGPIAAGLALPAQFAMFRGVGAFAIDTFVCWLLLGQFRLWDDIVDRERDRDRHRDRVLTRTRHVGKYIVACAVLAMINALLLRFRDRPEATLPLLAILTLALAVGYTLPKRSSGVDLLRLAKYPVFVLLVAMGRTEGATAVVVTAAIAAFAAAVTYEVWHDPETPLRLLPSGAERILMLPHGQEPRTERSEPRSASERSEPKRGAGGNGREAAAPSARQDRRSR